MIRIAHDVAIEENEIEESFVRASGPGGQNVNKLSTAVELRFNVYNAASLPDDVRARLIRLAGKRVSAAGDLIITSQRFRTQAQNRADARARLGALLRAAVSKPTPRRKTSPGAGAMRRRIEIKRKRGETKIARRKPSSGDNEG